MPRLRFTRDERGYENTFLVHTTRRRGRERTRILYWFRSPPHVKVGRAAFDEEAIHALEETHPEITFEWPAILEARPPTDTAPAEPDRLRRRGGRQRPPRPSAAVPALSDVQPEAAWPAVEPATPMDESLAVTSVEPEEGEADAAEAAGPATYGPSAAERALGPEGLSRVRARYAEVLARISNRVTDAAAADKLRELAEGLNPDAWVTADEVDRGLESFERLLELIRQQLGHRRERPRPGDEPGREGDDARHPGH